MWSDGYRFQPQREVEAKRAIVARAQHVLFAFDSPDGMWPDVTRRERFHARMILQDLAMIHADHPDYDEEWRP